MQKKIAKLLVEGTELEIIGKVDVNKALFIKSAVEAGIASVSDDEFGIRGDMGTFLDSLATLIETEGNRDDVSTGEITDLVRAMNVVHVTTYDTVIV